MLEKPKKLLLTLLFPPPPSPPPSSLPHTSLLSLSNPLSLSLPPPHPCSHHLSSQQPFSRTSWDNPNPAGLLQL